MSAAEYIEFDRRIAELERLRKEDRGEIERLAAALKAKDGRPSK